MALKGGKMSIEKTVNEIAKSAKASSRKMSSSSTIMKNKALELIAKKLVDNSKKIQSENEKDLEYSREKGMSNALIDRLTISDKIIDSMVTGLNEVIQLPDPVGSMTETYIRPNGLKVSKMRIPLGVIGIIYESRPNVTVDAAALCLKAGNSIILRGGSEAFHSNTILADLISEALKEANLPEKAVQVIPVRDREAIKYLLKQEEYIDLIIPRGGEGLIRFVVQNSQIPVLKHYKGVCHVYVDSECDLKMAQDICFNSKVQRPGVCNAMETMLVHESIASSFFPDMVKQFQKAGVEIRACEKTQNLIHDAKPANEDDWYAEYLDLILAVKIVKDLDEAIEHIDKYSSNHTETIVTTNINSSQKFLREVDSSVVAVNASTRFNDGGQLGLGAEIGISTSKLHAFGPMGISELTGTKFIVIGNGQLRQ